MIEDAQIVQDTRKVRCSISETFGNDVDRYIDYLLLQENKNQAESSPGTGEARRIGQTEGQE